MRRRFHVRVRVCIDLAMIAGLTIGVALGYLILHTWAVLQSVNWAGQF